MFIKYIPELDEKAREAIQKVSPDKRNGNQETMYGYKIQDALIEYLYTEDGLDILKFFGFESMDDLFDIVSGKKLEQNFTSKQTNIIIKQNQKELFTKIVHPVFFRSSKANYVGAMECSDTEFEFMFKKFAARNKYNFFPDTKTFPIFYYNSGMSVKKNKKKDKPVVKRYQRNIHRDWRMLVQFVFQGNDKNPRAQYFMFYDKERKVLFLSTIEEYIEMLETHHVRGTFKTRMKWCRSKNGKIKFKIPNPVWLLDGKRKMPFWNMPIDQKVVNKNIMRAKQGKEPYTPVRINDRWM